MKELLEAEKANAPSIEEEIEAARAKVDARTPITEDVSIVKSSSSLVNHGCLCRKTLLNADSI